MLRHAFSRILGHTEDRIGLAILLAALALFVAQPAFAHGFKIGALEIGHPWARMTPAGAKVGGGYLSVTNKGTTPDTLVSATAEVADHAEIHEMSVTDGVMKMRMLKDGVVIPAGGEIKLAPGGFHLMLIGLKQPLKQGETFKGTLTFEKAGTVDVVFKIEGMGGPKASEGSMDGAGHDAHSGHEGTSAPMTMPMPSN
ncbi:copper chaperone PCu(A)C [Ancylobacter pratisalsi]|uniref:Copper chaperone PCu(A)C n=1 Tax=Ancylobacter pratisalsi TaxID=1745854 RepID=A0A6P1YHW5_9HYPH|nr:copper chaperone PCu(A)C [Ancylobacter pratisalsi]QIB32849.1 copper chaperone PCu(A)C [Ancylobacter pratisalsi]